MTYAVIATWKMGAYGAEMSQEILAEGGSAAKAAIEGVSAVEDEPSFHSVGYGGRPDRCGHVVLDGGFMDGDTLHFGAVGSVEGFRSPVRIAESLSHKDANNFLCGKGAELYAKENGFEQRDNLTEEAREIYEKEKDRLQKLHAYDGHDTVCFLTLDTKGSMCAAVSTSGLFMKDPGRVGDSPIPGSGYYADSQIGAAAATGMGEEIMKGSLSRMAVYFMEQGMSAMEAAQKAVDELDAKLRKRNGKADAMSLIALAKDGSWGVGTNVDFPFAYASDATPLTIFLAVKQNGVTLIREYEKDH
ncbi:MAG: isoaspartyl peptidase/L-asparaginase [Solobacterium sp.]|nr:isoaspartyl peptidase/L-asparaginase [Solobacterium sp.]